MPVIQIPHDQGFGFGPPISDLFKLMKSLALADGEPVEVDFRNCRFLNPIFLLGAKLILTDYAAKGITVTFQTNCQNQFFRDYLELIHFENSFRPEELQNDECESFLRGYHAKTYLPLTEFPASLDGPSTRVREYLQGAIATHIRQRLSLTGPVYESVSYLIDEMVNNIKDHSRQQYGYLFTQFFPSKKYIDICFADLGVGFLGSYQSIGRTDIATHEAAIHAGRIGDSTKQDPQRGFGFRTSKNLLVNGLKGKYFLLTGDAFLYSDAQWPESIRTLKINPLIEWPGTLVAMRIPMQAENNFNIYDYLE
jgi:hypothetical protein